MPSTPSPRTRGPKAVRVDPDRILDAAQAVFAKEGLQAASLRAIANQAGCDPALIYYHFDSKEALFGALLARRFPVVLQEVEALADPEDTRPASERLWAVLRVYHRHLKDDPGIRSMIRGELVRGAEGVASLIEARVRPVLACIRAIFEQGVARRELRPNLDPLLGTFFLVKMQLEILDVLPVVLPRFTNLSPEAAVHTGMRAWFELFWLGIALDPAAPLPTLPDPD